MNFVRASPKHSRIFDQLNQYAEVQNLTSTAGLCPLCPTRWTVRTAAIRSVLDNYEPLQEALYEVSRSSDDSATKALGSLKKMQSFDESSHMTAPYKLVFNFNFWSGTCAFCI